MSDGRGGVANDTARLRALVAAQDWLMHLLRTLEAERPGTCCVGAGAIAGLVWNSRLGREARTGVKDVDIAYFDSSNLSEAAEKALVWRLAAACPDAGLPFDVKNQARVHLWYAARFGYPIAPYRSLEAAIATWPTTATAVGVTLRGGTIEVIAPFGLRDLFDGVVRPNKAQITREIYEAKVRRWRDAWPELTVVPWDG